MVPELKNGILVFYKDLPKLSDNCRQGLRVCTLKFKKEYLVQLSKKKEENKATTNR